MLVVVTYDVNTATEAGSSSRHSFMGAEGRELK